MTHLDCHSQTLYFPSCFLLRKIPGSYVLKSFLGQITLLPHIPGRWLLTNKTLYLKSCVREVACSHSIASSASPESLQKKAARNEQIWEQQAEHVLQLLGSSCLLDSPVLTEKPCKNAPQTQRITKQFGLEGTLKLISFQHPCHGRHTFHQTRLPKAPSILALDSSRHGAATDAQDTFSSACPAHDTAAVLAARSIRPSINWQVCMVVSHGYSGPIKFKSSSMSSSMSVHNIHYSLFNNKRARLRIEPPGYYLNHYFFII